MSRVKKIAALILSFASAACTHNVSVIDEAGNPLADAQVHPLTRTFNYPPVETNAKGTAFIHQDIPTIENLQVTKSGYLNSGPINYNLPKPITIVLKKE